MNRGSIPRPLDVRGLLIASMRPRFMNRGSDARADAARALRPASMRPRFMNRGSRFGEGAGPGQSAELQ